MVSRADRRWSGLLLALTGAWVFSQTVLCPLYADEARLLGILTNTAASTGASSAGETPTSLAKRLIQKLKDTEPTETVTHVARDGTATTETRTIATPPDLRRMVTPGEEIQILQVLDAEISDHDFFSLPPVRRKEILTAVEMAVNGFPSRVGGVSLAEADRQYKLDALRMNVRILKNFTVMTIDKPEVLAKQLSLLVARLATNALQDYPQTIAMDPRMRSEVEQYLEDQFSRFACDTTSTAFKRALPEKEFQALLANLENFLRERPSENDMTLSRLETFNNGTTNHILTLLDNSNHRKALAISRAMHLPGPALQFILEPYESYGKAHGLANVDFSGGVSAEERWRVGLEMGEYMQRDMARVEQRQQEQMAQFQQDFQRRVADGRLKRSGRAFGDPNWDLNEVHNAIRDGNLQKIKSLLKDNPGLAIKQDAFGYTPLHYAAAFGEKDMAELLLTNRADVNAQALNGATPLHWAVEEGHKNLVELLLTYHADVNAKNSNGSTPLHMAEQMGRNDLLELLKDYSAPKPQPLY